MSEKDIFYTCSFQFHFETQSHSTQSFLWWQCRFACAGTSWPASLARWRSSHFHLASCLSQGPTQRIGCLPLARRKTPAAEPDVARWCARRPAGWSYFPHQPRIRWWALRSCVSHNHVCQSPDLCHHPTFVLNWTRQHNARSGTSAAERVNIHHMSKGICM